jgi:predicted Rossmann fold nucleotide-binding protein DprA/Smf involved in DNA uptake
MPSCPICNQDVHLVIKEWNYSIFHVKNLWCNNCSHTFKAYYRKGILSHTTVSKKGPHKKATAIRRKILGYLSTHDSTLDDMAQSLKISPIVILKTLEALEKQGRVSRINYSQESDIVQ